jgi:hypothetical protein
MNFRRDQPLRSSGVTIREISRGDIIEQIEEPS